MPCNERRKHIRAVRDEIRRADAEERSIKYSEVHSIGPQNWVVGMTVAYRQIPRVKQTLKSVEEAGFKGAILFVEPGSNDIPEGYHQVNNKEILGNWGNFCNRVHYFSELDTLDNTKFLFIQDDVDFLPDTRAWVENNWPCNNGPISLYRSAKYVPTKEVYSKLRFSEPFLGMLALILNRDMLLSLRSNLKAMTNTENKKDDVKFGIYCNNLHIPINIVNASRCQHTGEVSSLYTTTTMTKFRRANTYV